MQIGIILVALAFPLLELAVLIKVGQVIGFWWTVLLLVAMGVGGGLLVQKQGMTAARRAFEQMAEGEAPLAPVLDSFLIMLAGLLLLIPGLITDVAGLLLLVPPIRRAAVRWGLRRAVAAGNVHVETREWRSPGRSSDSGSDSGSAQQPLPPSRDPLVIDGEWQRVDEPKGSGKPQPGDTKPTGSER